MYKSRAIGRYNVAIHDGQLDTETNKWHYVLQIDKFDKDDKWQDSNYFYIEGHEDGSISQAFKCVTSLTDWINNVTEKRIAEMFNHKKNHVFKLVLPVRAKVI